jgi:hypothetical protein
MKSRRFCARKQHAGRKSLRKTQFFAAWQINEALPLVVEMPEDAEKIKLAEQLALEGMRTMQRLHPEWTKEDMTAWYMKIFEKVSKDWQGKP